MVHFQSFDHETAVLFQIGVLPTPPPSIKPFEIWHERGDWKTFCLKWVVNKK